MKLIAAIAVFITLLFYVLPWLFGELQLDTAPDFDNGKGGREPLRVEFCAGRKTNDKIFEFFDIDRQGNVFLC